MHICFLDIDGTLVRTGGAGQAAFAQTLAEDFGIPEIDGNVGFSGRSDRAIAMDLFKSHGLEPSEENWQRFCTGYLARLENQLRRHDGRVLPGVVEFLNALQARGDVAIGLLTGNLREGARRKLGHYGLWHWFPFGGFGDAHCERCDIAVAAMASAKRYLADSGKSTNGHAPANRRVMVIGDTPFDVQCGRTINACCVGVPTGTVSADALRASNPDVFVDTLEDFSTLLAAFD
jgi:phosphoglycolate phosphatase-like HAD superfamily hydrolase